MFAPMSAPLAAPAPAAPTATTARVASIDLIRGAVMVLMAIDHVRVYSGLPAGGPTAGIFFTRWITHFVAPAFIFPRGDQRVLLRAQAHRSAAIPVRPRRVAGAAGADGDSRRVDVQLRLRELPAGGRHLGHRLVHDPDVYAGAAAAADRWHRRGRDHRAP